MTSWAWILERKEDESMDVPCSYALGVMLPHTAWLSEIWGLICR